MNVSPAPTVSTTVGREALDHRPGAVGLDRGRALRAEGDDSDRVAVLLDPGAPSPRRGSADTPAVSARKPTSTSLALRMPRLLADGPQPRPHLVPVEPPGRRSPTAGR